VGRLISCVYDFVCVFVCLSMCLSNSKRKTAGVVNTEVDKDTTYDWRWAHIDLEVNSSNVTVKVTGLSRVHSP